MTPTPRSFNLEVYEAGALRVLDRCNDLARHTDAEDGICRTYLSAAHRACNDTVSAYLREAGLTSRIDAAGNVVGHRPGNGTQTLLLGSHLDTVPNAGRYDGVLGVLLAVEVADRLQGTALPFHLDVVGFGEEEGVRFGATLLTSRAVAGTWDDAWATLRDDTGTTLAEAMTDFGLDIGNVHRAARAPGELLGYLEAHIEQGPVLEALGIPVAAVTGIAGAKRLQVELTGRAAHAGTTPMPGRRDALLAAAECIQAVEAIAFAREVTATVGSIAVAPNAVNVVPGAATFTIDLRAADDAAREQALAEIAAQLKTCCAARRVTMRMTQRHEAPAVHCDQRLTATIANAIGSLDLPVHRMPSGAGHDAMALASACPVGMLFVRCTGGLSHHPDEAVTLEDVCWALAALERTVVQLAQASSPLKPDNQEKETPS